MMVGTRWRGPRGQRGCGEECGCQSAWQLLCRPPALGVLTPSPGKPCPAPAPDWSLSQPPMAAALLVGDKHRPLSQLGPGSLSACLSCGMDPEGPQRLPPSTCLPTGPAGLAVTSRSLSDHVPPSSALAGQAVRQREGRAGPSPPWLLALLPVRTSGVATWGLPAPGQAAWAWVRPLHGVPASPPTPGVWHTQVRISCCPEFWGSSRNPLI